MPAAANGLIDELAARLGAQRVLTSPEDVAVYAYDGTPVLRQNPACVVFPKTTAEVAACVKAARRFGAPIVTRGSGTGLSGGSVPMAGCVVLCLTGMDRILEVDPRNLTIEVEAGVVTQKVDEAANMHGLFYPPDPGSRKISTIGGNVAENSGGLRGLKYGVTRDYVLGLEAVLASGEVVWLGNKCVKDVAGYNLRDLFIGSEGTLGIVTRVLLKLVPQPAARKTMLASYTSIEAAGDTVSDIIAAKIIPCTLEFLDQQTIRCVEDFAHVGLPTDAAAVLIMETDGHPQVVAEEAAAMAKIAAARGAIEQGRRSDPTRRYNERRGRSQIAANRIQHRAGTGIAVAARPFVERDDGIQQRPCRIGPAQKLPRPVAAKRTASWAARTSARALCWHS